MKGPLMKKSLVFLLFFAAGAAFAADRPLVNVTIDLPQAKLLPGVPFDITVTYKNASDQFVAVGKTASLIITPQNGTPVRLQPRGIVQQGASQDPNLELQPKETQVGTINWHANWFYEDAAFTVPGIYDIALEIVGDAASAEDETFVYAGTIRTAPTRLVRIQPAGE